MSYILSIDAGTTSVRAGLVNSRAQIKFLAQKPLASAFPQPGWVEQNPLEIWLAVQDVVSMVLKSAKVQHTKILGLALTNQRETVVAWHKHTGQVLHPAIGWQDRRTASFCEKHISFHERFKNISGLTLNPYFSATKMLWLKQNVVEVQKNAKNRTLCFGTLDSYLLWQLTGGQSFKTDATNASRTLLMDLKTLAWSDELLDFFSVKKEMLPQICSNVDSFGVTKNSRIPNGIPILAMAGDQQSALFGQGCFKVGDVKCTYGTGSFMLVNIGSRPDTHAQGLLCSVGFTCLAKTDYVLEGGSFVAGGAIDWFVKNLKLAKSLKHLEQIAQKTKSANGAYFIPALAGLGAPYWNPKVRGVFGGLTQQTHAGHLAVALLEGLAHAQVDILEVMASVVPLKSMRVDGGVTRNKWFMQTQADLAGITLLAPKNPETTLLGVAFMAGLEQKLFLSEQKILDLIKIDTEFLGKQKAEAQKQKRHDWQMAINRALTP